MSEEKDKGKMLMVGDMVNPTGFARVLHSLIKYFEDDYDITGVGVNYRGDPHNLNIPVYPAYLSGSIYGEKRVCDILNQAKFDVLFILNDPWVINKYLEQIKKDVTRELPQIVVYFPVDSKEHDPDWYANFDIVDHAVTYTQYGKEVVLAAKPELDVKIVPHGVDTSVFYKKYKTKKEAKIAFFKDQVKSIGDLDTSFIVLNANRNQPRKKLDVTMKGFALFARRKPDNVKLYMHCGLVDASMNVGKYMERYRIGNRLIASGDKRGIQVVPESILNDIYNACDVGINTSMGEGWGLTNIEHAITDAAQIVPDHSSCRELFSDCGLLMPTSYDWTFDNSMTVGRVVTPETVAEKLEYLYANKRYRLELGRVAMEKFTSEEWSWEQVAKKFKALFEEKNNVTTVAEQH